MVLAYVIPFELPGIAYGLLQVFLLQSYYNATQKPSVETHVEAGGHFVRGGWPRVSDCSRWRSSCSYC